VFIIIPSLLIHQNFPSFQYKYNLIQYDILCGLCQLKLYTLKVANITVVDLDVTSSSNGDCMDSVRIFDGYRSTDPLLATLCGSVTSGSYRTSQSKAYIVFKTDRLNDGGTGYKFRITFLGTYYTFIKRL